MRFHWSCFTTPMMVDFIFFSLQLVPCNLELYRLVGWKVKEGADTLTIYLNRFNPECDWYIILLTVSMQYQAAEWWELRQMWTRDNHLIQRQILRTNFKCIYFEMYGRLSERVKLKGPASGNKHFLDYKRYLAYQKWLGITYWTNLFIFTV